jgi:hypothetical protein
MSVSLLVKMIAAIEPEKVISHTEFQQACGITSNSVAKSLLNYLRANDIGYYYLSKDAVKFSASDKIYTALLALRVGGDIEQVSSYLTWKDFEKLTSELLTSFGYRTRTNVRLAKPRMEVDVVGTALDGFTLAVDCKHWKRNNLSSISLFCEKQAGRAKRLIEHDKSISQVVPVVLTLHAESVSFVHEVPIVPILKFRSFLLDVKGFLPRMYVVSASGT